MVGYDYRHITMSFYLFTENPPYLSKLHFAPVLRALATTIATQWKGSRQKQKVGQKATSFGFALERAANSIPNFPAAVNIVIKKSIILPGLQANDASTNKPSKPDNGRELPMASNTFTHFTGKTKRIQTPKRKKKPKKKRNHKNKYEHSRRG